MEAGKLEERIREFLQRLEQRKNLLNLTVNFYKHTQEVSQDVVISYNLDWRREGSGACARRAGGMMLYLSLCAEKIFHKVV